MKFAIQNNLRIESSPIIKDAICPLCTTSVIAKCGRIKIWHFAHKSLKDCDTWNEPETEWHLNWKNEFLKEQQEVIVGNHRADIKLRNKVIELQNSSISPQEIEERENFYEEMIWILNGNKFAKNLDLRCKGNYFSFRWKFPPKSWWTSEKLIYIDLNPLVENYKRKIKNCEKRLKEINLEQQSYGSYINSYNHEVFYLRDSFLELSKEIKTFQNEIDICENNLFLIKKIYTKCPCGGWGIIIPKKEFIEELKKEGENEV